MAQHESERARACYPLPSALDGRMREPAPASCSSPPTRVSAHTHTDKCNKNKENNDMERQSQENVRKMGVPVTFYILGIKK